MEKRMGRYYRLESDLSKLFDLETSLDTMLSVSMYKLNQFMESERSSIFLFDPSQQQLTSFSSLDLDKHEIRMAKSSGVAGWVFEHRLPAIVNNAYGDSRFFSKVDEVTGFRTRNLICTPLIDSNDNCLGTIQSINKKSGNFTSDDIDFLNKAAALVVGAINRRR